MCLRFSRFHSTKGLRHRWFNNQTRMATKGLSTSSLPDHSSSLSRCKPFRRPPATINYCQRALRQPKGSTRPPLSLRNTRHWAQTSRIRPLQIWMLGWPHLAWFIRTLSARNYSWETSIKNMHQPMRLTEKLQSLPWLRSDSSPRLARRRSPQQVCPIKARPVST